VPTPARLGHLGVMQHRFEKTGATKVKRANAPEPEPVLRSAAADPSSSSLCPALRTSQSPPYDDSIEVELGVPRKRFGKFRPSPTQEKRARSIRASPPSPRQNTSILLPSQCMRSLFLMQRRKGEDALCNEEWHFSFCLKTKKGESI
jgi:hypothetical protein